MKRTTKEIQQLLKESELSDELITQLQNDKRIGVQKAIVKWLKEKEQMRELESLHKEMSKYEQELWNSGITYIAGIDEVGRGPLAGPVVAAAVILPPTFQLLGLTDSKKISKRKRELFYEVIQKQAISIGVGMISAKEIDRLNIYEASKAAMLEAIKELHISPDQLLIDAMVLPTKLPQRSIIKGDSKSISIAASSIVAKVVRDRYMENIGRSFPEYGFEKHMGYGTKEHIDAIDRYGICDEHRLSFAPVRERISLNRLFN